MDFGISEKITQFIMRPPRTIYNEENLGMCAIIQVLKNFNISTSISKELTLKSIINEGKSWFVHCLDKYLQKTKEKQLCSYMRIVLQGLQQECLPGFNVACFDCSGSGLSEGKFVTLGYNEKEDLHAVLNKLKTKFNIKKVILWGRSMGAVTSLMYAGKYPKDIKAVISDNAFADLQKVCKQLKDRHFSVIPDFLVGSLLNTVQQHINETINASEQMDFQLKKLKPKNIISSIQAPVFYIYSQNDQMVNSSHTMQLYQLTNSYKKIISVQGDHNGSRSTETKMQVINFLMKTQIDKDYTLKGVIQPIKTFIVQGSNSNTNVVDNEDNQEQIDHSTTIVYQSPLNKKLHQKIHQSRTRKRKISITETNNNKKKHSNNNNHTQPTLMNQSSHIIFNKNQQESNNNSRLSSSLNTFYSSSQEIIHHNNRIRKKIFGPK